MAGPAKLPNADQAVIQREKLTDYLLSRAHPAGRFKAQFFAKLGFQSDNWPSLEVALRTQHLSQNAQLVAASRFGKKYEIRAMLKGPLSPARMVVSIWIIEAGELVPRFVTAYPGGKP